MNSAADSKAGLHRLVLALSDEKRAETGRFSSQDCPPQPCLGQYRRFLKLYQHLLAATTGPLEGSMERRRAARFGLNMPVICQCENEHGRARELGGFSRNISTTGLFVAAPGAPSERTPVAVTVLLPPLHKSDGHALQLKSKGLVVRAEPDGFAVSCEFGKTENLPFNLAAPIRD